MRAKKHASNLWSHNRLYLIFLLLVYVSGVTLGALAVPALSANQKSELASYLDLFIKGMSGGGQLSGSSIFRLSLFSQYRTAALIWVLGITIIGAPLVLVVLFVRGFVSGFTVGFMSVQMGTRGLLLASASIAPHSLVSVPVLLVLSLSSLLFSGTILRQSMQHKKVAFMSDLIQYTSLGMLCLASLLVASAIEAYITPALLRNVSTFLTL